MRAFEQYMVSIYSITFLRFFIGANQRAKALLENHNLAYLGGEKLFWGEIKYLGGRKNIQGGEKKFRGEEIFFIFQGGKKLNQEGTKNYSLYKIGYTSHIKRQIFILFIYYLLYTYIQKIKSKKYKI